MSSPLLWYLNRATGVVLMVLLTLAVVLGLLSTVRGAARPWGPRDDAARVPRFVIQSLHRNLSLLGLLLLVVHVVSAVVDTYVDIRWWQALVPWGGTYRPVWLALGTVALDLLIAVAVTSLLRSRLRHRGWRATHLLAYAAWVLGLAHGWGIGTDSREPWAAALTLGCVTAAVLALIPRLVVLVSWRHPREVVR